MTCGLLARPAALHRNLLAQFPNVWVHGDWARWTMTGFGTSSGRQTYDQSRGQTRRWWKSNPRSSGMRAGERQARPSGVTGRNQRRTSGLFLCAQARNAPNGILRRRELRGRVLANSANPCCRREVKFVRDLPKTRNAKNMRPLSRAPIWNRTGRDVSSWKNPAAVEEWRNAQFEGHGRAISCAPSPIGELSDPNGVTRPSSYSFTRTTILPVTWPARAGDGLRDL